MVGKLFQLSEIGELAVADYFQSDGLSECLCCAGEHESSRQKVYCDVARYIAAVKDHFVTRDLEVIELKSNLPEGLADLVDQRELMAD